VAAAVAECAWKEPGELSELAMPKAHRRIALSLIDEVRR